MNYLTIIYAFAIAEGIILTIFFIVHWAEIYKEYCGWGDGVRTVVVAGGSLTLAGAAMHLLALIR